MAEEFARCGVELVFLQAPSAARAEDQLLVQFQGVIAEYERAQIVERSRRGKQHRAQQGSINVLGGAPRLAAQLLSVEPDQIESMIARLATAGHEVIEVRAALLIQHHDLAIQDRPLPFQTAQNLLKKRVKLRELLPLARHQPCLLAVDIQDPPKAVMLRLVYQLGWPTGSFTDVKGDGET